MTLVARRSGTLASALSDLSLAALRLDENRGERAGGDEARLALVQRSALSLLVRLLLLPESERRKTGEPAALDLAIERRFPGAPPRPRGPSPREIPASARSLSSVPPRDVALALGDLTAARLERRRNDLALVPGGRARKDRGAFFTPPAVARALASRTLASLPESAPILDPACGAGALLDAAASFLLEKRKRTTRENVAARLIGADADPDSVLLARAVLRESLGVEPRVIHADSLATPALAREHGGAIAPPFDRASFPELARGPLAVIGNPPFVASYARGAVKPGEERRRLLAARFPGLGAGEGNTFLHFLALALELVRDGRIGLVLPDTLLVNERYERPRRELAARSSGLEALVLDWPVFGQAAVRTALVLARLRARRARALSFSVSVFPSERALEKGEPEETQRATRAALEARPRFTFPRRSTDLALEAKIRAAGVPLGELCWVKDGINPGPRAFRDIIVLKEGERARGPLVFPCIEGKDVLPYRVREPRLVVRADPALLTPELRRAGASFRESWIFEQEKLVSRQTSPTLVFAREPRGFRALNSIHATGRLEGTEESLLYFLGVLSSAPLRWFYARTSGETRKVFPQVHVSALRRLPVPRGARLAGAHDEIVALARALEESPDDATADRAVDRLVSTLLGLTREQANRLAREAPPRPGLIK